MNVIENQLQKKLLIVQYVRKQYTIYQHKLKNKF